ncbi:unnamed protein product, partial [Gulo gulo]
MAKSTSSVLMVFQSSPSLLSSSTGMLEQYLRPTACKSKRCLLRINTRPSHFHLNLKISPARFLFPSPTQY